MTSPPEKDRPAAVTTAAKASQGPAMPSASVPPPPAPPPMASPVPAEPMPAETRRLPKAAARPAPVLAILRARWPWLVVAGLLGTVAGLFLAVAPTFQATSTLGLSGFTDSNLVKQSGQTYAQLVTSPEVMDVAVPKIVAKYPGLKGLDGGELAAKTTGTWTQDTNLIAVTVKNPDGKLAIVEANAVASAVLDYVRARKTEKLNAGGLEVKNLFGTPLPDATAEAERKRFIGQNSATNQLSAIQEALSIGLATEARVATSAGTSRPVSAGLGGIGGLLVGGLIALVVGAGRRRVRTPAELRALAPELNLRATTQAGEVAGRLLESGHSTLVVLSLPSTPSSASRFAAAVANHLRTHGSSVTLVNAIALESGDSSSMSLPDEVWVLRRDIRQDVKSYFSTDVLVVACTAEPEAVGLISGQSDLMAVVVAKEGRSTLQQIWDTVSAVESADPIVVLAP